jgi:hypothetical protein
MHNRADDNLHQLKTISYVQNTSLQGNKQRLHQMQSSYMRKNDTWRRKEHKMQRKQYIYKKEGQSWRSHMEITLNIAYLKRINITSKNKFIVEKNAVLLKTHDSV